MQARRVNDLVRTCDSVTITAESTVRDAAFLLMQSDTDLLVVCDPQGRLAGVLPESSVIRSLMNKVDAEPTIQHLVCHHVESVRLEAPLTAVLPLFRAACNSVIPVVDHLDHVCGTLSRRDVMQMLLEDAADANVTSVVKDQPTPGLRMEPMRLDQPADPQPQQPSDGNSQRPHFLRGEDALRRLRTGDSQRDDTSAH
ncbi:MAG: CBS domain-containing protein [Planctomycetaceae bacterium]|nr:CBS domain-containing protein [Planctomycetaceae bacterium]